MQSIIRLMQMIRRPKLLEDESLNLLKWFLDNLFETNNNKYYLMTNMQNCMNLKRENRNAESSTCVKI